MSQIELSFIFGFIWGFIITFSLYLFVYIYFIKNKKVEVSADQEFIEFLNKLEATSSKGILTTVTYIKHFYYFTHKK